MPSQWLYKLVKKSILKDFPITVINNGVDTTVFKPLDKEKLRKKYGADNKKKVISFISHGGVKNPWKGGEYMVEIINKLQENYDILFLEIGTDDKNIIKKNNWWKIPFISDPRKINELLNLSDVFLFTSIAENFPLVLLEAQSAGIPVVTFDVGGACEIVRHMQTGYVSKFKDVADTVLGVEKVLNDYSLSLEMRKNSRERVLKMFSQDIQTSKFLKLFRKAINEFKAQ